MLEKKSNPADLRSMESNQGTRTCKRCLSQSQKEFSGELAIHFKGLAGLNKPIVWVFPKLLVCSQCGFRRVHRTRARVAGASRRNSCRRVQWFGWEEWNAAE